MALNANALTNLATVLDELGLTSDAGVQDARVQRYINAASDWIEVRCNRTFRRTDAIVENLRGYGLTELRLSRVPVVAITSIVIDGAALAAADYELRDVRPGVPGKVYRSVGWPWSASMMPGLTYPQVRGTEKSNVVVTYNGGWVTQVQLDAAAFTPRTLPSDIEDACVQLVTSRWRGRGRDKGVRSQSVLSGSVTFGGEAVPPEVLAILSPYERLVHA